MGEYVKPLLHFQFYTNKNSPEWVIFLHGMGGNHHIFYKQIKAYKQKYNILLIDLPGHGDSPNFINESNLLLFTTNEIKKIMDQFNIQAAHFVGVSLGTIIMQQIGIAYPQRVKSMTLAGAISTLLKWGEMLNRITLSYPTRNFLPFMLPYTTFAYILMPKRNHKLSRDIFIREAQKLNKRTYLQWSFIVRDAHKIYKQMSQLKNTIPKIYISGDEDHMLIKGISSHVQKEDYSTLHLIHKCGHVCNIEKAHDFNEISLSFIKENEKVDATEKIDVG